MTSRKCSSKDFLFKEEIGHGSYSTVYRALDRRNTKNVYAIKVCSKSHIIREAKVKYVTIEKNTLNLLARANHPGIVKLYYTFHDEKSLYFVLDFAPGGELLSLLHKMGKFTEQWAKHFTVQLIDTLLYIHSQGVIHRDLKPENVLLDKDGRLMITDFGAASTLTANAKSSSTSTSNDKSDIENKNDESATNGSSSFVGTAEYVSPELLLYNQCNYGSDIWALGCMIYQFLEGHPPFRGENELKTFEKIVSLDYSWNSENFSNPNHINSSIINLVRKILIIDTNERPSLKQIQADKWLSSIDWNDKISIWKGIWQLQFKESPHQIKKINNNMAVPNSYQNMISNRQLHVIDTPIKNISITKQKKKKPTKVANTTSSIVEWRKKLGIATNNTTNNRISAADMTTNIDNINNDIIITTTTNNNNTNDSINHLPPKTLNPDVFSSQKSNNKPSIPRENISSLFPQSMYEFPPDNNIKAKPPPQQQQKVNTREHSSNSQENNTPNNTTTDSTVKINSLQPPSSVSSVHTKNNTNNITKKNQDTNSNMTTPQLPKEFHPSTSSNSSEIYQLPSPIPPYVPMKPNTFNEPYILKQDFAYIHIIPYKENGPGMTLKSYNKIDNDLITSLVSQHETSLKLREQIPKLLSLKNDGSLSYRSCDALGVKQIMVNIGDTDLSMYDFEFDETARKGYLILEKYKYKVWFISLPDQVAHELTDEAKNCLVNTKENWVDSFFRVRQLIEDRKEAQMTQKFNNVSLNEKAEVRHSCTGMTKKKTASTINTSNSDTTKNSVLKHNNAINAGSSKPANRQTSASSTANKKHSEMISLRASIKPTNQFSSSTKPRSKKEHPTLNHTFHAFSKPNGPKSSPSITSGGLRQKSSISNDNNNNSRLRTSRGITISPIPITVSSLPSTTPQKMSPNHLPRLTTKPSSSMNTSGTTICTVPNKSINDLPSARKPSTPLSSPTLRGKDRFGFPTTSSTSVPAPSQSQSPRAPPSTPKSMAPTSPTISTATVNIPKRYQAPKDIVITSSRYEVIHSLRNRNDGIDQAVASSGASAAFKNLQKRRTSHNNNNVQG